MKQEYEIIAHNNVNFHVFLVKLLYRTPHIHRDFELCLILEGSVTLFTNAQSYRLKENDIFIFNPFCSHEIKADDTALILSLQVSPNLFSTYYPYIRNTQFDVSILNSERHTDWCQTIRKFIIDIAITYFYKEEFYEFKCVNLFNQLFLYLLTMLPNHIVSENKRLSKNVKGKRIQIIAEYIDEHYAEKLLLTDIAKYLRLDLHYLSHFFKENFGLSFQNYLLKIRCEHARKLLILSDISLLDISVASGFSDPKYFNKGFHKQYGCSPKEYRKYLKNQKMKSQDDCIFTTQEFFSEENSAAILEKYQ